MTYPYRFAAVTTLVTPQIDADFDTVGGLVVNQCTATGTNTIALTSVAGQPTVSAYTNYAPIFAFPAANTNSGATTINVNAIGAKPLYKDNGSTAAGASDIVAGRLYYVAFNQALNAGGGGFVIINPTPPVSVVSGAVQGTHKNLVVTNGGTPNTQCLMTADSLSVSDGANAYSTLLSVSVTVSSAASGANGLDTGSVAASTWYAMYVIYNPNTVTKAALMSLSFTSPTLPSGYTQFARVGAMLTDGSSNFLRIIQKGNSAQYQANSATNTPSFPSLGAVANGGLTAVSVSTLLPPTATEINGMFSANVAALVSDAQVIVAPNNTATSNFNFRILPYNTATSYTEILQFNFVLEGSNIYYQCTDLTSGTIRVIGWKDSI